jgi:hypothetical protein
LFIRNHSGPKNIYVAEGKGKGKGKGNSKGKGKGGPITDN